MTLPSNLSDKLDLLESYRPQFANLGGLQKFSHLNYEAATR